MQAFGTRRLQSLQCPIVNRRSLIPEFITWSPTLSLKRRLQHHRVHSHGSVEEAYATASHAMELLKSGQQEKLLAFMPDAIIDHCLDRKRAKL